MTSIWRQGWISTQEVGLEGPHACHWNRFTGELKKEHIKLGESQMRKHGWKGEGSENVVLLGYEPL